MAEEQVKTQYSFLRCIVLLHLPLPRILKNMSLVHILSWPFAKIAYLQTNCQKNARQKERVSRCQENVSYNWHVIHSMWEIFIFQSDTERPQERAQQVHIDCCGIKRVNILTDVGVDILVVFFVTLTRI